MFCPECGTDNCEGGRFCSGCGREIGPRPAEQVVAAGGSVPAKGGRSWLRRPLVLGVIAATVGVAIGVAAVSSIVAGNAPEDRAVALVPPDAAFYATVHLDPSLGQKRAAKTVLDRVGSNGDSEPLENAIGALVEATSPLSYEREVKPYAGDQMAVFARAGEGPTLLAATRSPEDSRATMRRLLEHTYPSDYYSLREATYRDQPYEHVAYAEGSGTPHGSNAFAIIDGFVVLGDTSDVKLSIDAHRDNSLAETSQFSAARERLSGNVLGFAYLDAEPLARMAEHDEYASRDEVASLEAIADAGPIAASLSADDGRLALDIATRAASGDGALLSNPSTLLKSLPADVTAALAFGDLQGPLANARGGYSGRAVDMVRDTVSDLADLDLDTDFASWLGQLGVYVAGDDPDTFESAVVAETRSPDESSRVIGRIDDHYSSSYDYGSGAPVQTSDDGLGFDVLGDDEVLSVRGDDDRVILGSGKAGFSTERALDAEGGFGESDLYRRAAGLLDGYEPFLTVDAASIQRLIERAVDAEYSDSYVRDVRPWLSSLDTVAAGVRSGDDGLRLRLVASIGPERAR